MIDLLEKDKLASDVVTRIGLYRLYQIWQEQQMTEDKEPTDDDDDDFPEAIVDVEDILSLAKNIDTELYLMLAKQTGKKAGQIDIAVYLKGLKPGDYSEEEVVEALPSIEEFNLKELSWLRGNISAWPTPSQTSLRPFSFRTTDVRCCLGVQFQFIFDVSKLGKLGNMGRREDGRACNPS